MRKTFLNVVLLFMVNQLALAADLMDVYEKALANDPIYKAAYSEFMAKTELIPQARSELMPQLLANTRFSQTRLQVTAGGFTADQAFTSRNWTLNASQAIFNMKAWSKLQKAKASVKAALAAYNHASQDLLIRTAAAYFEVLLARDTLEFAEAKLRANKRQLEQARQRFDVGLDAITSVYEAKAAHDQSIAEVISAKNNQINQNENLRKLTNHVFAELSALRDSRIPLLKPEPANVDEWIATSIKQNYELLAAKYKLLASRENMNEQNEGNWPVVSLDGNLNDSRNNLPSSNFFAPTYERLLNVSLTVKFPIYQGGLVASKTRQSQYEFQNSSEEFEKVYRDTTVNSQIAYNTIIDGISKVKADRQTIVSQKNSLESTEAQFQVGTRTMVDVVNAQQRLFEAQEQLARDQYGLIKAVLKLKFLAGTLNIDDIAEINAWLNTTRINGFIGDSTKS